MKRIFAIARNTFRESVRNRIFYLLIGFGLFFALSSRFISLVTVGDQVRVLKDVGLGAIHFFSILIVIFTGINLIYQEIERRTLFNLLSKPVSRGEFILGKFFGLALTAGVSLGAMAGAFSLFLLIMTGQVEIPLLVSLVLLYEELLIITALALLFSSFTTSILAFLFTVSLTLIGRILWTYNEFQSLLHSAWLRGLSRGLYLLLPNLDKFNIQDAVIVSAPLSPVTVALAMAYGAVYIVALLALTLFLFQRRQF